MNFLSKIGSSFFQIISLLCVLGFLLGILNIHFSDRNDYCVMTYMFEYPQFVQITVPENAIYPQYGLYAYSEGRLTEKARKMWFDGVPVLFVPGNSGSHMQVRSLASVALQKALSNKYEYHFDYYTVNLNEELSGIYGSVLQSQTEFTAACITKIMSLYKSNKYTKNVPTSIILIGHSMGGLVAKRLMAYPDTLNMTNIAITLAAPLQSPVVNTDIAMNNYYKLVEFEWDININRDPAMKQKKTLISFGNGARDILMPPGLTSSNDSTLSALSTAIPGVWVSPDHVSIVWCKQLVMAINRYLFAIVDQSLGQLTEDTSIWTAKAKQFFQANRTMFFDPDVRHSNATMLTDAFWYEDSRRIYQISRPEISRMTYLMIRLVTYPQNRFLAIESVNLDDKEWIFGCNAKLATGSYRYCNRATALSEMSRWTGAATKFGKRKLATVHLHSLKDIHPDWTHVIVKLSPTRKPVTLNVDVNDHASRVIDVDLRSDFSFGKTVLLQETAQNSLYYELNLQGFNSVHQSYLLYIEPTESCKASQYHVSAELHVPWAKNHEYSHYFTKLKRSPMKLRLFTSNPNLTMGAEPTEHAKITILLDHHCTFTISIAQSWYNRLSQMARNYTTVLVPYIAAIVLLATRTCIISLKEHGSCPSIHSALMSEGVKPYYALVFARLGSMAFMSMPTLAFLFENASWKSVELHYFTRSLLVLPTYLTALGILNIGAAALIGVMVFSSQLAHRLLFRIVWRGGPTIAEKVASGLQKVPMVVSCSLVCAVPLSCGAASLAVGTAFYAFMISKMYEEYLEDYVYKLMAKVASMVCRIFKSGKKGAGRDQQETRLIPTSTDTEIITAEPKLASSSVKSKDEKLKAIDNGNTKEDDKTMVVAKPNSSKNITEKETRQNNDTTNSTENTKGRKKTREKYNRNISDESDDVDDDLNNLNFHVTMFMIWFCVTLLNVPALLTWAKNFKYSMVLKSDTSYHIGLIMSVCSAFIWQMDGPRKKLKYYEQTSALLFTMSVFILALGPLSLTIVNYGLTCMFVVVTIQQMCDKGETVSLEDHPADDNERDTEETQNLSCDDDEKQETHKEDQEKKSDGEDKKANTKETNVNSDCDMCNESRIYRMFKRFRDKFSFSEDT